MNLYLDIETIPVQRSDRIAELRAELASKLEADKAAVKAPGNYSKPESINAYIEQQRAALDAGFEASVKDAIEKTSLDGTYGQIVCIGWAIDDEPVKSLCVGLEVRQEGTLLREFVRLLPSENHGRRPVIVGHNVVAFDLPFIFKRAIINSVRLPLWWPRNPKPWSEAVFDTMTQWAGDRNRIGLDRLCRALDLPGKGDGPTGADIWPMAQAERYDEIAAYCRQDVERVRAVHKRMAA